MLENQSKIPFRKQKRIKVGLCTMKAKEAYHFLLKHNEPSDMFLLCFPMQ